MKFLLMRNFTSKWGITKTLLLVQSLKKDFHSNSYNFENNLTSLSETDGSCGLDFVELGIDNTLKLGKEGFTSEIYDSNMIMKSGYVQPFQTNLNFRIRELSASYIFL